jgi:serine/threonine-protein kinase
MARDDGDDRSTEAVASLFLSESDVLYAEELLPAGAVVGAYAIERQIGAGGMGVVYAATHQVIGKRVAIKVLRRELSDDEAAIDRFVMEARAVNAIGHPNIVDIFDLGALPDGRQYLVMDLLAGETLRRLLERGPLHVSVAAKLIDDIADALVAAHDKGIIHRDLKPDNVLVVEQRDRHPEARLVDFGIAKLVAATHPEGSGVRTRLGVVLGTPGYMSPEQARARNVDHRTDIYALGVMSFELLAGRRPYERTSVLDLLVAHAEAPVPELGRHVPSIPVEVCQLVEAMLAKRPDDRPTLAAVRTLIKRLQSTVLPSITEARAVVAGPPRAVGTPAGEDMHTSSGPTRDDRPEQLASTTPLRKLVERGDLIEQRLEGTFELAVVQMAPSVEPPPKATVGTAAARGSRPRVTGPQRAETLDEPVRSSKLWIVFVVLAIAVAVGGVLLGMRI